MHVTEKWLREIGAVRPMATAGETVLVLGSWHAGYYPIHWSVREITPFDSIEQWHIFGLPVSGEVTRADCVRILTAFPKAKGADDGER